MLRSGLIKRKEKNKNGCVWELELRGAQGFGTALPSTVDQLNNFDISYFLCSLLVWSVFHQIGCSNADTRCLKSADAFLFFLFLSSLVSPHIDICCLSGPLMTIISVTRELPTLSPLQVFTAIYVP
jgi:hypothetical protein